MRIFISNSNTNTLTILLETVMEKTFTKQDTLFIKGCAILFLLFHHCFLSPGRYKNLEVIFFPFTEYQVNHIAAFFKICVGIFVFLTAYEITASLKDKYNGLEIKNQDLVHYASNRYIKLFMGWIIFFCPAKFFV